MNFPHSRNQIRTLNLLKILIILVFSLQIYHSDIYSQTNPTIPDSGVDLSFDPKLRNPSAIITAKQYNGKFLVYGKIDELNNQSVGKRGVKKLIRLNEDGSIDNTFSFDNNDNEVSSIFPLSNGQLYIENIQKQTGIKSVQRLNLDGSFDYSFNFTKPQNNNIQNFPGDKIKKIILRNDGKLLFFGLLAVSTPVSPQGQTLITKQVALINQDGSVDQSFRAFVGESYYYFDCVTDAFLTNDGKIIVSGAFSTVLGPTGEVYSRNGLARLNGDGSIDTSFDVSLNVPIHSQIDILPISNNQFYIFGQFNKVNGLERKSIARLNTNGEVDESFNYIEPNEGLINSFVTQSDGKLTVSTIQDLDERYSFYKKVRLFRLFESGDIDNSFVSPEVIINGNRTGVGNNDYFKSKIYRDNDDGILISNSVGKINGKTSFGIIRLHRSGTFDEGYQRRFTFSGSYVNYDFINAVKLVDSVAVQPDGKIIVTGYFSIINGEWIGTADQESYYYEYYTVRLNSNGSFDKIIDLKAPDGGKLQRNGELRVFIDKLGRTVFYCWANSGLFQFWRTNSNGTTELTKYVQATNIFKVESLADGKLIFTDRNFYRSAVKLNEDFSVDASFQLDSSFVPTNWNLLDDFDFTVQDDGKTVFNGFERNSSTGTKLIPRLLANGSIDNSFDLSPYPSNTNITVNKIASKKGKIYISARLQPTFNQSFYRLDEFGTIEKNYNVIAQNMLIQPDEKIIFMGQHRLNTFRWIKDKRKLFYREGIFRMDQHGTIEKSFSFLSFEGIAFSGRYNGAATNCEMALQPDGNLIVVGDFDEVNGVRRVGIVRLKMN
jgi:uncharacterized delta-60 repeat protein